MQMFFREQRCIFASTLTAQQKFDYSTTRKISDLEFLPLQWWVSEGKPLRESLGRQRHWGSHMHWLRATRHAHWGTYNRARTLDDKSSESYNRARTRGDKSSESYNRARTLGDKSSESYNRARTLGDKSSQTYNRCQDCRQQAFTFLK